MGHETLERRWFLVQYQKLARGSYRVHSSITAQQQTLDHHALNNTKQEVMLSLPLLGLLFLVKRPNDS